MAMFVSVAKILRLEKSTEHIYEVILINTEPSHVKSGADLHGKENVILFYFFFLRAVESKREVPRGIRNSKVRRQDKFRRDWSRH